MSELKEMLKKKMAFNGNEIVFTDNPKVGVAGIPHDMPDELAEEIVKRWNRAERSLDVGKLQKIIVDNFPSLGCEQCSSSGPKKCLECKMEETKELATAIVTGDVWEEGE